MEQQDQGTIPRKAYLQIHIAVLLFGFTAILGDLIQLNAVMIVWWRVLLTSISLLVFTQLGRTIRELSGRQIRIYAIIGMLIGLHWICFYGSVKLANASVCLICMSTTSFFTSLLEPVLLRTRLKKAELLLGFIIIPAMYLVVAQLDGSYTLGVIVGLLSALLAAVFSILNKKHITKADPYTISLIELSSAWGMISVFLAVFILGGYNPGTFLPPSPNDWLYILILAFACTTLAHILTLKALKYMSAFSANLAIHLEPVYGILLAIFLLGEHRELPASFFAGALLILVAVIVYPYFQKVTAQENT